MLLLIGQLKSLNVPILEVDEKRMSHLCLRRKGEPQTTRGIVVQLSAAALEVEIPARGGPAREDPFVIV